MEVLELLMIGVIPANVSGDYEGVTGTDASAWSLTILLSQVLTRRNLHSFSRVV